MAFINFSFLYKKKVATFYSIHGERAIVLVSFVRLLLFLFKVVTLRFSRHKIINGGAVFFKSKAP